MTVAYRFNSDQANPIPLSIPVISLGLVSMFYLTLGGL
jgi:hypothetical protein